MNIINPHFKLEDNNIFEIRKKEFQKIEENVRIMLKPAEELGFSLTSFGLRESRSGTGELFRTLRNTLVIKLTKNYSEIDLSIVLPQLIHDNYIKINGRLKIPMFQLFDLPIVNRGNMIKLRTNVATIAVSCKDDSPFIYINILGKTIPLSLLMFACYRKTELVERFDLENVNISDNSWYSKLLKDLKGVYCNSKGIHQDDFIRTVGKYYSKYDAKTKGEDVIYALDIMLKTDIDSAKFFRTGSVIDELIEAIKNPDGYDDYDIRNKRVRCIEYMIYSKISKIIFDFCLTNRTKRHPKFNINSTQVISDCNVSDIVQFDFSINPVDELTKLSRCTLVGPGGFKKENVPNHLRDILPTMFGRICPVDTPDRDNCGVLQNLLPNVDLDENLQFTNKTLDKQPVSIPVSLVPFLEHDDQTRLQMVASQMRQAIMLKSFEAPHVKSGTEHLYTHHTQFIKIARKDGEVIYLGDNFMIVKYDDGDADVFDIKYRKIYVGNLDMLTIYVNRGSKVKKGEILAESSFCNNGGIVLGKNLRTAVMIYYGYNYEDGIVISDRLTNENRFTSLHYKDLSFTIPPNKLLRNLSLTKKKYRPLPSVHSWVVPNKPYARMKDIPTGPHDYSTIFEEDIELTTDTNVLVSEVNLYGNKWNETIPEYKEWVENKIKEQENEEAFLQKLIREHVKGNKAEKLIKIHELDRYSKKKYKEKGELVNGLRVEMYGLCARTIQVGDKIANRHGNKGVVSAIIPHDKMPKADDGRPVDICINPLGMISRMNIGQLFELHLSESIIDFKNTINKMIDNNEDQQSIKDYILKYVNLCDNTEEKWVYKQFSEQLPEEITKEFIDDFSIIQPPFESITIEQLDEIMKFTNTKYTQKLYDPHLKDYLQNEIAVGSVYFYRLVHIAESRLSARGIGSYTRKTLQPLAGRRNKGGQRCGEMETACLIAHDAMENLFEMFTTKSDCIDTKNNYVKEMINTDLIKEDVQTPDLVPESVHLLNSYLTVLGLDLSKENN